MSGTEAIWLEVLKASLGPAVALLAIIVAIAQWSTARQKILIDLFDRRTQVLERLERAIGEVMRQGEATNEAFHDLLYAEANARFLFGKDVQKQIASLRGKFAFLRAFPDEVLSNPTLHDRENHISKKYQYIREINDFQKQIVSLFGPYMQFTYRQRMKWWPAGQHDSTIGNQVSKRKSVRSNLGRLLSPCRRVLSKLSKR